MKSCVAAEQGNTGDLLSSLLAAFLTAFYMGRQLILVFGGTVRTRAAGAATGKQRHDHRAADHPGDALGLRRAAQLPGRRYAGKLAGAHLGRRSTPEFLPPLAASGRAGGAGGLGTAYLVYGVAGPSVIETDSPRSVASAPAGCVKGMHKNGASTSCTTSRLSIATMALSEFPGWTRGSAADISPGWPG